MTPPATHPFGTGNSLAQMGSSFIELLSVVDAARIPPHGGGRFSFAAHNAAFLARAEGMSMLVLSSEDARADEARWRESGLTTFEPVYFERKAALPDGREARVAFTIAFAVDESMPDAVFFCCQQHAPEGFWHAQYQHHDNGAVDFSSVVLASDDPQRHRPFFETLMGAGSVRPHPAGFAIDTAMGSLEVVGREAVVERLEGRYAPLEHSSAHFAAAGIRVEALSAAAACLERGAVDYVRTNDRILVPPETCFGLTLELVED